MRSTSTRRSCSPHVSNRPRHLSRRDSRWQDRAERLLRHEIQFIPSRDYETLEPNATRLAPTLNDLTAPNDKLPPRDLPAHLARLCEARLLTAEEEVSLFREMNYLKFRANALRTQIDPDQPDRRLIVRAEQFLTDARTIRDLIVRANMRLVISIVKKFVKPNCSFDEMLSDGIMSLMQAVEKFDVERGFRFSTYAYRAISRNAYRSVMNRQKAQRRFQSLTDDDPREPATEASSAEHNDSHWDALRDTMTELLAQLDRRERFIIRGRYALGSHRKVQTFQSLADKLGVSKERVRQLEQRGLAKMRERAEALQMEDLFDLAVGVP